MTSTTAASSSINVFKLKRLNRILFNHYPDSVFTLHTDGTFHTVNRSLCKALQQDADELTGKLLQQYIHPEHWEAVTGYFAAAQAGTVQRYEAPLLRSTGQQVYLEVTLLPLKIGHDTVGIFGVAQDITVQHKREQALLRTTKELGQQNEELELFRKIIAHDFRSPVARLVGLSKLLQRKNLPESTSQTAITSLLQSAKQLDGMVQDLNQMLSMRHHGSETREACHLVQLMQECLESLHLEIADAAATIQVTGCVELFSVKAFLASIFQNLISNAIKYRHPERPPIVAVTFTESEGMAIIRVEDNGLGMDLDQVSPQLFGMYKRFHEGVDGKGLGLYLVREQVKMLSGKISVASEPDKGTTFRIELPLNQ